MKKAKYKSGTVDLGNTECLSPLLQKSSEAEMLQKIWQVALLEEESLFQESILLTSAIHSKDEGLNLPLCSQSITRQLCSPDAE